MSIENYLIELLEERKFLDPERTAHSFRWLEKEIEKVKSERFKSSIHSTPSSHGFQEEIIELSEKIVLPVKEFPKFNFVGKILGPKGTTLRGIQQLTNCKITILGQGSTRDRDKERELSESGDEQYDHFKEPLHLLINVEGPKSEVHGNLSVALKELSRCLGPEEPFRQDTLVNIKSPLSRVPDEQEKNPNQPIIRFGIPPPGAIILDQSLNHSAFPRADIGRQSPDKDYRYAEETRDPPSYSRYSSYDKTDYRLPEKRGGGPSDYPVKKKKDYYTEASPSTAQYHSDQYSSVDSGPYRSSLY